MRIIAGEARGRRLIAPHDRTIRPPLDKTRESIFSRLEGTFEGRCVLDLFAGVGSLGLEALSRGARRAVFVEKASSSLVLLEKNIQRLGFGPRSEVVEGDALKLPDLRKLKEPSYSLVFLDPPFSFFKSEKAVEEIYERVRGILGSGALEAGANVLLRQPAKFKGACPIPICEKRAYGESVLLRFLAKA